MTQKTTTDEGPIDEQYSPVYEYDEDAGPSWSTTGKVVYTVPRDDQIKALRTLAGKGPVEPDGWFRGYNETSLPVVDGVPIPLLENAKRVAGGSEGVESWGRFVVDDSLGTVELHWAGGHPENVSKIKVNEKSE